MHKTKKQYGAWRQLQAGLSSWNITFEGHQRMVGYEAREISRGKVKVVVYLVNQLFKNYVPQNTGSIMTIYRKWFQEQVRVTLYMRICSTYLGCVPITKLNFNDSEKSCNEQTYSFLD